MLAREERAIGASAGSGCGISRAFLSFFSLFSGAFSLPFELGAAFAPSSVFACA